MIRTMVTNKNNNINRLNNTVSNKVINRVTTNHKLIHMGNKRKAIMASLMEILIIINTQDIKGAINSNSIIHINHPCNMDNKHTAQMGIVTPMFTNYLPIYLELNQWDLLDGKTLQKILKGGSCLLEDYREGQMKNSYTHILPSLEKLKIIF